MSRILLADDDAVTLRLLTTLMELEGNQVTAVTHPEAIFPAIEQNRPDIVLLDYHFGGENSKKTLELLKSRDDTRNIRVLMISGMDRQDECLRAGADGFVLKPFKPAELIKRIGDLLTQDR